MLLNNCVQFQSLFGKQCLHAFTEISSHVVWRWKLVNSCWWPPVLILTLIKACGRNVKGGQQVRLDFEAFVKCCQASRVEPPGRKGSNLEGKASKAGHFEPNNGGKVGRECIPPFSNFPPLFAFSLTPLNTCLPLPVCDWLSIQCNELMLTLIQNM